MQLASLFTFLLGVAIARATSGNLSSTQILIRKCCPAHLQLGAKLDSCVPYGDAFEGAADVETESAASILNGTRGLSPWWMNANIPVYDASTGDVRTSFILKEQPPTATVRFGPGPPCPRREARYFLWTKLEMYKLLTNGTLLLKTDDAGEPHLHLTADEYCVDRIDSPKNWHVFFSCACNRTVCVTKCCNKNQVQTYVIDSKGDFEHGCRQVSNSTPTETVWKPRFSKLGDLNKTREDVEHIMLYGTLPNCDKGSHRVFLNGHDNASVNSMWILPNGSALMQEHGHGEAFPPMSWCGDTRLQEGGETVQNAEFCVRPSSPKELPVLLAAFGSLHVLSALFLLLTLVVYGVLPELRRSTYAKALLCHVVALLSAAVALASGQLRTSMDTWAECYLLAFVIQYSMIAAYFWLNAVCFEIAGTFSDIIPGSFKDDNELRKLLLYSLYAWGCPAIVTVITIAMQFSDGIPENIVRPSIGLPKCWMGTKASIFAYFYAPTGVALLANLVFYVRTAVGLIRARRETASVAASDAGQCADSGRHSGKDSALHNSWERVILHLKLFLLMGATWLMECVSAAVGHSDAIWIPTDVLNILRGFFVFAIFCCKKDVMRRLQERLSGACSRGSGGGGAKGGDGGSDETPTTTVTSVPTHSSSLPMDALPFSAAPVGAFSAHSPPRPSL